MKKKDLRNLLRIEEGESEDEVKKRFKEIAEMLFQDFHIEEGGGRYDFLEVKFYFYNEKHPDLFVFLCHAIPSFPFQKEICRCPILKCVSHSAE